MPGRCGSGGGAGGILADVPVYVSGGMSFPYSVGVGGATGAFVTNSTVNGGAGGPTIFGSFYAGGGLGGQADDGGPGGIATGVMVNFAGGISQTDNGSNPGANGTKGGAGASSLYGIGGTGNISASASGKQGYQGASGNIIYVDASTLVPLQFIAGGGAGGGAGGDYGSSSQSDGGGGGGGGGFGTVKLSGDGDMVNPPTGGAQGGFGYGAGGGGSKGRYNFNGLPTPPGAGANGILIIKYMHISQT